jgi:hypothetical protein
VPYPGTFVLDDSGLIRQKHFEQSYRVRPTRSVILEWAGLGGHPTVEPMPSVLDTSVAVQVWTDVATYRPYQKLRLHVRLVMPAGVHVYAAQVPPGYEALSVQIEPLDGLECGELVLPEGQPFSIDGLDEAFVVYAGTVEGTLPFMLTRNLGATRVGVRVSYQACTEVECFPPTNDAQHVALNGLDLIRD